MRTRTRARMVARTITTNAQLLRFSAGTVLPSASLLHTRLQRSHRIQRLAGPPPIAVSHDGTPRAADQDLPADSLSSGPSEHLYEGTKRIVEKSSSRNHTCLLFRAALHRRRGGRETRTNRTTPTSR